MWCGCLDIKNILRLGYFDRLKIDNELYPVYKSSGIEIQADSTFLDSADISLEAHKYGFSHLKLSIIGECDTNISFLELERMRDDRSNNNLIQLKSTRSVDRYLVGYADLIILKSSYSLPSELLSTGKTEYDIEKLAQTSDMLELMLSALELQKWISSKHPDSKGSIVIVNKLYVYPIFRRNGISTWMHQNLSDMVNLYSLMYPSGIILTYGDFANEAKLVFGMTNQAYTKMLIRHYKCLGYKDKLGLGLGAPSNLSRNLLYKVII